MSNFLEKELAVVIWINPNRIKNKRARRFETISSKESNLPVAFSIESLLNHPTNKECKIALTEADVSKCLKETLEKDLPTRVKPLIVPIRLATAVFGWENFHVPTE